MPSLIRKSACAARALFILSAGVAGGIIGPDAAQASPPTFAAAYSFDAPVDLYLSEDVDGCTHHMQQRRPRHTHVLGIVFYPDAYCSLIGAARCQYTFAQNLEDAFASGEHGIRRSVFTATWDDACVRTTDQYAAVVQGSISVSEASDLGMQGTFDLSFANGEQWHGVFDSTPCPQPRSSRLSCY